MHDASNSPAREDGSNLCTQKCAEFGRGRQGETGGGCVGKKLEVTGKTGSSPGHEVLSKQRAIRPGNEVWRRGDLIAPFVAENN